MKARGKSIQEILEIESIDWGNFWTDVINIDFKEVLSEKKFPEFDYFKLLSARYSYKGKVVKTYGEVAQDMGFKVGEGAETCRRLLNRCLQKLRSPKLSFRWNLDIPYRERLEILKKKYGPYANFIPSTQGMDKDFWRKRHSK